MCVIVHQPNNGHLDKETCKKLWQANPDGGGFAWINHEEDIIVNKSMSFPAFWKAFETARSTFPEATFLIHMRVATHGSVCIENVHPFKVDDHTVMAHNGIIHGVPDYKDDRTDTAVFIAEVLPELPPNWLDSSYLFDMVEEWLGWSKLMFLTTSDALNHRLYRLGDWQEWNNNLWLTNLTGLVEPKKKDVTSNTGAFYFSQPTSEDQMFGYRDWAQEDAKELLPEWEEDMYLDKMGKDRLAMQITHEVIHLSDGSYACYGCNTSIDDYTNECKCWETICTACWQFVAKCSTEGDCLAAGHVLYTDLERKDIDHVKKAITKTSGLALVPTQGAANMSGPSG